MRLLKDTGKTTFAGTGSLTLAKYYDVQAVDIMSLAVRNKGSGAITAFELRVKPHMADDGDPITIKSSNFIVPDANIVSCSLEPSTLASGATSLIDIDVSYRAQLHVYINAPVGTTVELTGGQYLYTGS